MAGPAGQQNTTSLSWRVRVRRANWKGLLFVWGTVVIGMSVGTVANLNTTTMRKTGETGTSLTAILSKLFIVLQKRQKTAPTSGSIPGAPEAFQADEIAEHASGTLPMPQVSPKPTQLRVGQRAIARDPVGETAASSMRKVIGCSFAEVIVVTLSQMEETGVSRFACPPCLRVERDQAKGRPGEVSLTSQTHDDYPSSRAALGEARKRLATWLHEKSIPENESQNVLLSAQQLSGGTTPSGGAYDI